MAEEEDGLLFSTKNIIRSLLITFQDPITLAKLSAEYREMEGCDIPYHKLGYTNLVFFLKSIPDVVKIYNDNHTIRVSAVQSDASKHIAILVNEQNNKNKKTRQRYRPITHQQTQRTPIRRLQHIPLQQNHVNTPNYHFARPQPVPLLNIYNPIAFQPQYNASFYGYNGAVQQSIQNLNHNFSYQSPVYGNHVNNNNPRDNRTFQNRPITKQVSTQNSNYVNNSSTNTQQPNTNGMETNGSDPINPIKDSPTIDQLNTNAKDSQPRPTSTNTLTKNSTNMETKNNSTEEFNYLKGNSVPECNDNETNTSLKKQLTSDNMTSESEHSALNICDNISLAELSIAVSDIDDILSQDNVDSDDDALPHLSDDDPLFTIGLPEGVLRYGTKIEVGKLPSHVEANCLIKVFVSEIHSPSKFWFHIVPESHLLDELMKDLQTFYKNCDTSKYIMKSQNIIAGQICAALYLNTWHRAEIVDVNNKGAKVFFFDYGTIGDVKVTELKYLLEEFAELPSQVFRGCLDYIKPVTHRWERDATYSFLAMVQNIQLYAKVTSINYEEQTVYMVLINTNEKKDIQINEKLITKGYAQLHNPYESNGGNMNGTSKRHFSEKYPTFKILENGTHPSFSEIGIMLAKGIDFYALLDENLIPGVDIPSTVSMLEKNPTLISEEATNFNVEKQKLQLKPSAEVFIPKSDNKEKLLNTISAQSELISSSTTFDDKSNFVDHLDASTPISPTKSEKGTLNNQTQYVTPFSQAQAQLQLQLQAPPNCYSNFTFTNNYYPMMSGPSNNEILKNYYPQSTYNHPVVYPYCNQYPNPGKPVQLSRPPPGFEHFAIIKGKNNNFDKNINLNT